MNGNQKFVTSQFLNVDGGAIDIQNLKPANPDDCNFSVFLSFIDGQGGTMSTYTWTNCDKDGEEVLGWADAEFMYAVGVTIQPGEAVWIQCDNETPQAIQSSGEVSKKDVKVELLKNGNQIAAGNPFPMPINLQDVMPEDVDTCNFAVFASIIDGQGGTMSTYTWTNCDKDGEEVLGWADAEFMYAKDVIIEPGDAIWVQCDIEDETQYIIFNVPETLKSL